MKFMTRIQNTVDVMRVEMTVIINLYLNFIVQWLFLCTTMLSFTNPIFCNILIPKRENFSAQNWLFRNSTRECLLRGYNWMFEYNSDSIQFQIVDKTF